MPPLRLLRGGGRLLLGVLRKGAGVGIHRDKHGKSAFCFVTRKRVLSLAVFAVGLFLFLYPVLSNIQYDAQQKENARAYDEAMAQLALGSSSDGSAGDSLEAMLAEARAYNKSLLTSGTYLTDPFDEAALADPTQEPYSGLLNTDGNGLMGYVDIPKMDVTLPIFHGTTSEVLEGGVGHLQPTSLPVGGAGTHSVLSAHTGLGGKKLFTDLDQLGEGDVFYLHVLGQVLAYRVSDIRVVLPDDVSSLSIDPAADKCTLVTCTPYGVNDHRLLVTGLRTEYNPDEANADDGIPFTSTSWFADYARAVLIWTVVIVVILLFRFIVRRRRRS